MSPAMALLLLSSTSLLALRGASVVATSADDCVLDLAIICLDDKLLVYVNWLEKRDKLNVVGDIVTIVKKKEAGLAEDRSKLQPQNGKTHVHRVSTSLGPAIDEYFDTHTIRISLPWILDDDIDLELDQQGNYINLSRGGAVQGTAFDCINDPQMLFSRPRSDVHRATMYIMVVGERARRLEKISY